MDQWALVIAGTLITTLLAILVGSINGLKKDVRTLSDKVLEQYAKKEDVDKCKGDCGKRIDDHEGRLRHVEADCCP